MLKGDTIRLQPWFMIRRVSWLYTAACASRCHKDDKGDWLHKGLFHSFWRWEILVWNLVFICPGGQFSHRYVIPMATRHIVQSSFKMQDRGSFFFKMESAWPVPFLPYHVHRFGDAIHSSHPLSSPSPPASVEKGSIKGKGILSWRNWISKENMKETYSECFLDWE